MFEQAKSAIENEKFYKNYLAAWNSGANARNYENYSRDIRTSNGYNNFVRSASFRLENCDNAIDLTCDMFISLGYQVLYGAENLVWLLRVKDNIPQAVIQGRIIDESVFRVEVEGDKVEIESAMDILRSMFSSTGVKLKKLIGLEPSISQKTAYLFPTPELIGKDHYYPWLAEAGETLESFIASYLEAKAGGLLFVGDPGTGKSTFIRSILFQKKAKENYLVTDEALMKNPGIHGWIEGIEHDSLLAMEDADNVLGARKDGNSAMSALLNVIEGIVPTDLKIVISTNLPTISRVDEALLRRGRMYRVVTFRLHTAAEAKHCREMDGLPYVDFDNSRKYSLAEVLNWDEEDLGNVNSARLGNKFGFAA